MNQEQQAYYNIPIQYRKMENLHIVFWIFKDIGWCMGFAWLGISMIIPTIIISIIIAWRTRNIVSELCHNLAITVWISANSFWMCTEFFKVDYEKMFEKILYNSIERFYDNVKWQIRKPTDNVQTELFDLFS